MTDEARAAYAKTLAIPALRAIERATRPIEFETGNDDWLLGSDGGTLTLFEFEQRVFAITCAHAFHSFDWQSLRISAERAGVPAIRPFSRFQASRPIGAATDTDLLDVVVFEIHESMSRESFVDPPIPLARDEVVDCDDGDEVYACGYLKDLSNYIADNRRYALCQMTATVVSRELADLTLRTAIAKCADPALSSLTGISGAPVYRVRDLKPCGMITRAGSTDEGDVKLHFVEMSDVIQVLIAARHPNESHTYIKNVKNVPTSEKT